MMADSVSDKRIVKGGLHTVIEKKIQPSDQIQAEDVKIEIREDAYWIERVEKVITEEKVMEKVKIEIHATNLQIEQSFCCHENNLFFEIHRKQT